MAAMPIPYRETALPLTSRLRTSEAVRSDDNYDHIILLPFQFKLFLKKKQAAIYCSLDKVGDGV